MDYRYLPEEVIVKPGDHLTLECTYDSTGRNMTTFGGLGTGQEMCLAFILYYPRIARARALSTATCDLVKSLAGMDVLRSGSSDDENSNFTFYQHFYTNNPWDSHYAGIAEAAMRFGYHTSQCYLGDGRRIPMTNLITYPRNIRTYIEPSRCTYSSSTQEHWRDNHMNHIFSASTCISKSYFSLVFYCFLLLALITFYKIG